MLYQLFLVTLFLILLCSIFLVLEMDKQDQRGTDTHSEAIRGEDFYGAFLNSYEGDHGVHACNKNSCGTIEGSNPSDDEELSDDDPYSQESAHGREFATYGDVKTLQEMGEGNVNVSTGPVCDYRAVVMALPQNECEDFKYQEGITPQNSLSIPSSDPLKDYDDEESQLVEGEILPTSCGFVRFGGVQRDDSEEFTDGESIEDCTFDFVSEDKKTGEPIYGLRYKIERNYFARFAKNWVLGRLQRDGLSLADITGEINSSSRVSEKPAEDSAAEDTEGEVSEGEEDSIAEDAGGEHGREVTHNESRERKCFEEIFAEMTGRGIPLLHLPLLSPLSEAADEVVRGEGGNGLNSLAEMDTEDEREKRKWHWASYICCCFCPDL